MDFVSHTITFLVGALTGAAATYLGNKYTDRRREKEFSGAIRKQFERVRQQMPELIAEMKRDLSQPCNALIREFYVTHKGSTCLMDARSLVYYHDDHKELSSKLHILENSGYITDVAVGNAPKYRLSEEFVQLVVDN